MANKKTHVSKDLKLEDVDINLFDVLAALDKKDYNYYDTLTTEQQKKVVIYMLIYWMSCVKGNKDLQQYYLQSTDYHANKYLFNENVQKHGKLQWLMLCAISPNLGKQFHQYIPNISVNVSKLKSVAKQKDIKEYYAKIYPNVDNETLNELATAFTDEHSHKMDIAKIYPNMKLSDIEALSKIISKEEISEYKKELGM
jgi:hypothetical protein